MSARIQQLKADLAEARRRLNAVLDQVGDRWDAPVYTEGAAWTVRQVAIHLMVSDQGQNATLKAIARGEEGVPADFDLERYNRRSVEKRAEASIADICAALAASFADREAWLDTLDEAQLERQGRHGSGQVLTVAQILAVIANHDRAHAADIARALGLE